MNQSLSIGSILKTFNPNLEISGAFERPNVLLQKDIAQWTRREPMDSVDLEHICTQELTNLGLKFYMYKEIPHDNFCFNLVFSYKSQNDHWQNVLIETGFPNQEEDARKWIVKCLAESKNNYAFKVAYVKLNYYGVSRQFFSRYRDFISRYRLFEVWNKLPYEKVLSGLGIKAQKDQSVSSWLAQRRKEGILNKENSTSIGSTWFVADHPALCQAIERIGLSPLNEAQIRSIKDRAKALNPIVS